MLTKTSRNSDKRSAVMKFASAILGDFFLFPIIILAERMFEFFSMGVFFHVFEQMKCVQSICLGDRGGVMKAHTVEVDSRFLFVELVKDLRFSGNDTKY